MVTTSPRRATGTRDVARGGLANLIGAGYAGVASFATTAIVTRIATPEDAGVYFAAISVLLIAVSMLELGVPVGNVYFISRYRSLGRTNALRKVLVAGSSPLLGFCAIALTLAVIFREQLGNAIFGRNVDAAGTVILILCLGAIAAIIADSTLGATRGFGVMRTTVVADKFVNPTIQLLALIVLWSVGMTGGPELIWTRVVAFAAVAGVSIPWLLKLVRKSSMPSDQTFRQSWVPEASMFREYWAFTGPRSLGQIAQVAIQRVDIVLVGLWLGPAEAAVYAAATRFLIFGQLTAAAIGTAVQPRISALASRRERSQLQDLYRVSTSWVVLATWPLYLTFILEAPTLMLVFGDDYSRGAILLQLLSAAMLVATACGAVDAVLLMAGKSTWTMYNAWFALAVNLALNIWLIPQLGIVGAAVAWVAAICANNLIPLVQAKIGIGIHPFGRSSMLTMLSAATLFGVLPWLVKSAGGGPIGSVITLVLAAAVYSVLLWRWRALIELDGLLRRRRPSSRGRGDF